MFQVLSTTIKPGKHEGVSFVMEGAAACYFRSDSLVILGMRGKNLYMLKSKRQLHPPFCL